MVSDALRIAATSSLRDLCADRYLSGNGIEIGALWCPQSLAGAAARYVDLFPTGELRSRYRELDGRDLAEVDVVDDGAVLSTFADGSVDFVIANQFLEHTEDPLAVLATFARVLRPGGILMVSVPEPRYGPEVTRPTTTVEHVEHDQPTAARHLERAITPNGSSMSSGWIRLGRPNCSRPGSAPCAAPARRSTSTAGALRASSPPWSVRSSGTGWTPTSSTSAPTKPNSSWSAGGTDRHRDVAVDFLRPSARRGAQAGRGPRQWSAVADSVRRGGCSAVPRPPQRAETATALDATNAAQSPNGRPMTDPCHDPKMNTSELVAAVHPKIGALGSAFYFHPSTLAVGKEHGLDGFRFYVLGRGGVLGDVEPVVIASAFGWWNPTVIANMWNSAKEKMAPRDAGRLYVKCSQDFGRSKLAGVEGLAEFCAAAEAVVAAADPAALALFAGLAAEPLADDLRARAYHSSPCCASTAVRSISSPRSPPGSHPALPTSSAGPTCTSPSAGARRPRR